ncbi:2Fe-2S iron-sulfur cluster binding domain-containing protein [bacterium]|nr:2Fe-2S iron-sulfur cluster binding domain-containing protein [bacterium]
MREHDQQKSDLPSRGSGFNRRDFLKGSGAAVAATALVSEATEAQAQDKKVASGPVDVTLNVNGKQQTLKLEPRTTLLDALRDDLNLTGCKEVCDTTNCGACTVMIDGKATYACTRLAVEVQGREIKTVESLRQGDTCDEVIDGFVKHDAMQCGFCTPGFVVATRAFLDRNPNASLEEIQKGLGGNICRCGTYAGITACALELAKKGGA